MYSGKQVGPGAHDLADLDEGGAELAEEIDHHPPSHACRRAAGRSSQSSAQPADQETCREAPAGQIAERATMTSGSGLRDPGNLIRHRLTPGGTLTVDAARLADASMTRGADRSSPPVRQDETRPSQAVRGAMEPPTGTSGQAQARRRTAQSADRSVGDAWSSESRRSRPASAGRRDGVWREATWNDGSAAREIAAGLVARGAGPRRSRLPARQTRLEWVLCDVGHPAGGRRHRADLRVERPHECEFIIRDAGAKMVIVEDARSWTSCSPSAQARRLAKVVYFDELTELAKPDAKGGASCSSTRCARRRQDSCSRSPSCASPAGSGSASTPRRAQTRRATSRPSDVHDRLHLGHDRAAQGRGAHAREHRLASLQRRARDAARRRDRRAVPVPAAGAHPRPDARVGLHRGFATAFSAAIGPDRRTWGRCARPSCARCRASSRSSTRGVLGTRQRSPPASRRSRLGVRASAQRSPSAMRRHEPIPAGCRSNALADKLVFSKLRAALGGRCRFLISGGAPLSPRDRRVLPRRRAPDPRGLRPDRDHRRRPASTGPTSIASAPSGRPLPGIEIEDRRRRRDPGARRAGDAAATTSNPAATAEAIEPDGWFHTGDIGEHRATASCASPIARRTSSSPRAARTSRRRTSRTRSRRRRYISPGDGLRRQAARTWWRSSRSPKRTSRQVGARRTASPLGD